MAPTPPIHRGFSESLDQVSVQTIYDLRNQGRGPRGFRVGRALRFRISEIEAWPARMEQDDDQRHAIGSR